MLGNTKGRLLNKYVPAYVLYDLETTGISCNYDEVIEISAIRVRNGVVSEEFSSLVNPGRPIPYAASCVNHITDDMVAGAPDFAEVLQEFLDFAGDDILVGHNINGFDMKFLYRDCEKFFGQTLSNDYVDTLKLSRICIPGLSHYRLGDLAEYYGFSSTDVQFLVQEKTNFDINNPSTYRSLKAGKLSYELIKDMLLRGLLTEAEIAGLKTKEYSKQVIPKIVYPILADNRSDNMGNGNKLRYRKNPVVMQDGRQIYVTQEWFDDFRDDLINWYETHISYREQER